MDHRVIPTLLIFGLAGVPFAHQAGVPMIRPPMSVR